jgi:hypothetical protein
MQMVAHAFREKLFCQSAFGSIFRRAVRSSVELSEDWAQFVFNQERALGEPAVLVERSR